ncbi:hypothetical protein WMF37_39655 [Sorangium sp. So ce291]|uniref:hypothetical protein n=1 Tax=Sorangium sp. So ce291 TaxID=3133294 RepID=UPI003F62FD51
MRHDLPAHLAASTIPLLLSLSFLSAGCSRTVQELPTADGSGGRPATDGATESAAPGEAAAGAGVPEDPGLDLPAAPPADPLDSTWRATGWLDGCQVEVADDPTKALPPLQWAPCPGSAPGCTSLAINWDADFYPRTASPSVVRWGDGYRLGMYIQRWGERRTGVYDVDGTPLAAWRTLGENCVPVRPEVGPERVWLGAQRPGGSVCLVSTYDQLAAARRLLPIDAGNHGLHATDDTLVLEHLGGGMITVYDRLRDQAEQFGPRTGAPELDHMHPVGDSVLGAAFFEDGAVEAWIWSRRTRAVEPLLRAPSSRVIADVKSDGQTLVWLEAAVPLFDGGLYGPSTLWTSPFATKAADVVPTRRRAGPIMGYRISAAGEGFYAVYAIAEEVVHVYRLADAHHWSFTTPPELFAIQDIAHVDAREVWVWVRGGIVRQAISELGPGDPAP